MYDLNPVKKITFYYFDVLINKEIIKEFNYLSSQNINSGLSTNDYIMIWRREELYKVLFHELMHYLHIDLHDNDELSNIIEYSIGKFNYPILINEAITEIQAQFFNTIYTLTYNDIDKTPEQLISLFKVFYNIEHIFSWYQFAKIMNFLSINEFDIMLIRKNFNQTTNVYSYFILKSIFNLYFFDIISELSYTKRLFNKQNDDSTIVYKIKNIIDNLPIVFLNKIIKINLLNKLNSQSLRMTII